MNFIGGKQNTEIHSNKTKPQGFMFKPWAYASWTMLTGLQATCTHAHKPSGHMQAHAQKPSGCMHASSPKGFCKLQPRQQAQHERLQHVESQAWFTIVQRHVPDLFGSVDLFVWPLPLALLLPIMPSVFIEQWQDPQTLALFERVWVSSYWGRAWTRHDYVLCFNAKYACNKKINPCNKKHLKNAN